MGGHALETSMQFDTFGFTAAEYARKQAEKEQQKRFCSLSSIVGTMYFLCRHALFIFLNVLYLTFILGT